MYLSFVKKYISAVIKCDLKCDENLIKCFWYSCSNIYCLGEEWGEILLHKDLHVKIVNGSFV